MSLRDKLSSVAGRKFYYNYKPYNTKDNAKEFVKLNAKPVILAVISLLLIGGFYAANDTVTGFFTYQEDLEVILNETKDLLDITEEGRVICLSELSTTHQDLTTCKNSIDTGSISLSNCNEQIDELDDIADSISVNLLSCETQLQGIEDDLIEKDDEYDSLIKNSVRSVCCSAFDIIEGNSVDWDIANNKISCGIGSNSVNCADGSTDF